ncbi:MAG: hypothetical protein QOE40_258, partial [Actinomycetota bacterium]|nr:hypothetical protein [Actinomycetota bacterium]
MGRQQASMPVVVRTGLPNVV